MPAYAAYIERRICREPGCNRVATHEVRNGRNETVGDRCKQHADALVARLNAEEDAGR